MGFVLRLFIVTAFVVALQCAPLEDDSSSSESGSSIRPLSTTTSKSQESKESDESSEDHKRPVRDVPNNYQSPSVSNPHPGAGDLEGHSLSELGQSKPTRSPPSRPVRDTYQQTPVGSSSLSDSQSHPVNDGAQIRDQKKQTILQSTTPQTRYVTGTARSTPRASVVPLPATIDPQDLPHAHNLDDPQVPLKIQSRPAREAQTSSSPYQTAVHLPATVDPQDPNTHSHNLNSQQKPLTVQYRPAREVQSSTSSTPRHSPIILPATAEPQDLPHAHSLNSQAGNLRQERDVSHLQQDSHSRLTKDVPKTPRPSQGHNVKPSRYQRDVSHLQQNGPSRLTKDVPKTGHENGHVHTAPSSHRSKNDNGQQKHHQETQQHHH